MSLPILIGVSRHVEKDNTQPSIQETYSDFLPSVLLYLIVLGLLFFNASAFEVSIILRCLYPFVAIPIVYYLQQVLSKSPKWLRWVVFGLGMLFLVSALINAQDNLMPLPVFIGVILGCIPPEMSIRRKFSPLALGATILLVVVLWKVILPSDKPATLYAGVEEEWVDSLEPIDTTFLENTVKEPSNLGRILHPSENPMVDGVRYSDRLFFSLNNVTHYTGQMILFQPWSAYYGVGALHHLTDFRGLTVLGFVIVLILTVLVVYGWRTGKLEAWLGAGVILLGLLPFINLFVLMAGGVADRYTFSASLGCIILFVYVLKHAVEDKKKILLIVSTVCALGMAYYSSHRMKAWENKEVLYTSSLQQFPKSAKLHFLNGEYMAGVAMDGWLHSDKSRQDFASYRNNLDSALVSLNTALSIDPTVEEWQSRHDTLFKLLHSLDSAAQVQANSSDYSYITFLSKGQIQQAFEALADYCITDSINCIGHHKEFIQSAIGVNEVNASFNAFNKLIEMEPLEVNFEVYTSALYPLAIEDTLAKRVLTETFVQGIERFPNSATLHFNYGSLLMTYNDFSNALVAFDNALIINPNLEHLQERIAICNENLQ